MRLRDAATSQQTPDERKGKKGPYPPTPCPRASQGPSPADTLASDCPPELWQKTALFLEEGVLVAQLCLTLFNPMTVACQAPLSLGILQVRILVMV